jgi:hypothetical protein
MPTTYQYYAAVLYALERIVDGHSPTKACQLANIPYRMFIKLVKEDTELALLADEAQQLGADTMADLLLSLGERDNPYHATDPKEQKVISENIKWVLSRRFNKKYGERVEIKQEITVSHVITSQLEAARERVQGRELEYVDAEYVMLPPPPTPQG